MNLKVLCRTRNKKISSNWCIVYNFQNAFWVASRAYICRTHTHRHDPYKNIFIIRARAQNTALLKCIDKYKKIVNTFGCVTHDALAYIIHTYIQNVSDKKVAVLLNGKCHLKILWRGCVRPAKIKKNRAIKVINTIEILCAFWMILTAALAEIRVTFLIMNFKSLDFKSF